MRARSHSTADLSRVRSFTVARGYRRIPATNRAFVHFYEPSLESCIHQPLSARCGMKKRSQITLQSDFLWCINMCRVRRFFSQHMAYMQCLNIFSPSFGHLIRSLRVSPRTSDKICIKMCPEGGLQTAGLEGPVLVTFPVTLCACVRPLRFEKGQA